MGMENFYYPCEDGYSSIGSKESVVNGKGSLDFTYENLTGRNVTEAIGDRFKNWEPETPVLIDAPTGSGKTTFVCKKLIPSLYSMSLIPTLNEYRTLLLVSNRAALVRQQKQKVIDAVNATLKAREEAFPNSSAIYMDSLIEANDFIDDVYFFGRVCVCSYQGLFILFNQVPYDNRTKQFFSCLKYVVFDEAHFFYSDATYNSQINRLLYDLPKALSHAIRIYMTATSWSIRNTLLEVEHTVLIDRINQTPTLNLDNGVAKSIARIVAPDTFYYYKMAGDYSSYNVHFFNKHGDCTIGDDYSDDEEDNEDGCDDYVDDYDSDDDENDYGDDGDDDDNGDDDDDNGGKGDDNAGKADGSRKQKEGVPALDALLKLFPMPTSDDKLLIFVKQKKDGAYLEEKYQEAGVTARFVDRSYRDVYAQYHKLKKAIKEEPKRLGYHPKDQRLAEELIKMELKSGNKITFWDNLILNEKFEESVLISTSVLDCGINLHDPALKTIALYTDEPTSFMQMIGRKRLGQGEQVDLWVYLPTRQNFSTKIQSKELEVSLGKKLALVSRYLHRKYTYPSPGSYGLQLTFDEWNLNPAYAQVYPDSDFHSIYRKIWYNATKISDKAIFYIDRFGHIGLNEYALWVTEQQLQYYRRFTDKQNPIIFRNEVYKWLGQYDGVQKRQAEVKQAIIDILEAHLKVPIQGKEEKSQIRELIHEAVQLCLANDPFPIRWENAYPSTLTKVLKVLGIEYTIKSDRGRRETKWIVLKGWEPEPVATYTDQDTNPFESARIIFSRK